MKHGTIEDPATARTRWLSRTRYLSSRSEVDPVTRGKAILLGDLHCLRICRARAVHRSISGSGARHIMLPGGSPLPGLVVTSNLPSGPIKTLETSYPAARTAFNARVTSVWRNTEGVRGMVSSLKVQKQSFLVAKVQ